MSNIISFFENSSMEWIYLLRIIIACICGGAIGVERSLRQKDAGFRTHIIVALGAALIMVISKYGFLDMLEYEGFRADASRIASNVVTGISFLGAGMIFVKGTNIRGLTTAAGIWSTAAVGMAIGAGLYITGIVSTVVIIFIQILFHTFLIGFDKILANDNTFDIVVSLRNTPTALENFKRIISENSIRICDSKYSLDEKNNFIIILTVSGDLKPDAPKVLELFNADSDIKAIHL